MAVIVGATSIVYVSWSVKFELREAASDVDPSEGGAVPRGARKGAKAPCGGGGGSSSFSRGSSWLQSSCQFCEFLYICHMFVVTICLHNCKRIVYKIAQTPINWPIIYSNWNIIIFNSINISILNCIYVVLLQCEKLMIDLVRLIIF